MSVIPGAAQQNPKPGIIRCGSESIFYAQQPWHDLHPQRGYAIQGVRLAILKHQFPNTGWPEESGMKFSP